MGHDPRIVVEMLRNHLAAHDTPLVFLFGAGTSSSVNIAPSPGVGQKPVHKPLIPSLDGLTGGAQQEVAKLGTQFAEAWQKAVVECGGASNVEKLLTRLQAKIDAAGPEDNFWGLSLDALDKMDLCIRGCIAKQASPEESMIPARTPHDGLADWLRRAGKRIPVEIFTTNYDTLIERALERARVPVFDGFVGSSLPFFHTESVDGACPVSDPDWVRLWKLHGSVNWDVRSLEKPRRIVRVQGCCDGQMILPSQRKYDESRKEPYVALLDRLDRMLSREGVLLVTCGFNFGDAHINSTIFSSLEKSTSRHAVALQFDPIVRDSDLAQRAARLPNLIVIGPEGGILRGQYAQWQLAEPVDSKTCGFMDVAFDSAAAVGDDVDAALTGSMRLGDFNWFVQFLHTMEPTSEVGA